MDVAGQTGVQLVLAGSPSLTSWVLAIVQQVNEYELKGYSTFFWK